MRTRTRTRAVRFGLVAASMVTIAVLVGTSATKTVPDCVTLGRETIGRKSFRVPPCMTIKLRDVFYTATLTTSMGDIQMLLDPILSPKAVNNFIFLARAGFYDNTIFHRVENPPDHALVQGGDPTGTGKGTAGYTFDADAPSPITQYVRGVVAMANTGTLSSTSSQFFIIVRNYAALGQPATNPKYAFFGFVGDDESLAILDNMVRVPVKGVRPVEDVVLHRVTIQESSR